MSEVATRNSCSTTVSGEVRISTQPGDYVFVPPYLPHREENPDPTTHAEIVVARSTQEPIVINLPELYPL